ncbi:TrkH family potassium uptake protein [Thermoanaerobacterium thermosaccharolyticum]|uniref:TrkH family potassium uptake protein n=1 Tax=Thermoanaerobacterium thermosaccharolyticum TaxID=1517 RepID=UPI003D2DDDC0
MFGDEEMTVRQKVQHTLSTITPIQVLALGFAAVILVGTFVLMLPISSRNNNTTDFTTALFTATSATCVTGLVVVDTGTYWSRFGQTVIMLLIQIGGLGFMSFATLLFMIMGKKITFKERLVMQEAMSALTPQGIVRLMRYALISTFVIEGIGAALLSFKFIPQFGLWEGLFKGIFHSVSAYNNAGFDIFGNFKSLTQYTESFIVNFVIMVLIVLGGLGFTVQYEIIDKRYFKKFSLHSKVVIITTLILIVVGALIFYLLEHDNPETMKYLSFKGKVLSSLFASITPRTAGFNTLDIAKMTDASNFFTVVLMFIGASPGSTGGGIKTSTFAVIVMTLFSVIKGREDTEVLDKRIPKDEVYRALSVVCISMFIVLFDVLLLSVFEKANFLQIFYEVISAFGTVGLTMGLTPHLDITGRIIIVLTMYAGRVGPLTVIYALVRKHANTNAVMKYPEGNVLIG